VAVLRDMPGGVETLLFQRPVASEFAAAALVFPGGRVDTADADPRWEELGGITVQAAEELMGNAAPPQFPARAFLVAAVREVFEESAVLLGAKRELERDWAHSARTRVHTGAVAFADLLSEEGLTIDLSGLVFFSRWITPEVQPRRYDTCFFACAMPPGQKPIAAPGEVESMHWTRPQIALEQEGWIPYTMPPTRAALRQLTGHDSLAGALESLRNGRILTPVMPRILTDSEGQAMRILMPDDPGYDA